MPRKLNDQQQKEWLKHHIPDRFRAAASHLEFLDRLLGTPNPGDHAPATDDQEIRRYCELVSIQQGRLAALRWLIEFVRGPSKSAPPKDVGIALFDGGVNLDDPQLSKLWKGCSQACGHPTYDTNHPPVDDKEQCEALEKLFRHLSNTVYKQAGIDLKVEILRVP